MERRQKMCLRRCARLEGGGNEAERLGHPEKVFSRR